jgi:hypothetical protein
VSENGCVGLVLVSHSSAIAEGLADLVAQFAGPDVAIVAVGGGPDGAATIETLRSNLVALELDGELDERLSALAEDPAEYSEARAGLAWNYGASPSERLRLSLCGGC